MGEFLKADKLTAGSEGFYSNDPNDAGGQTIYGIAQTKNPNWDGWPLVAAAKLRPGFPENMRGDMEIFKRAQNFRKKQYWDVLRLDEISNQLICQELYDDAINIGVGTAAKFLQTALNVSNDRGKYYPDIAIDGQVGPQTVSCVNKHPRPETLLKLLNVQQGYHYISITLANPNNEKYLNGWFTRVFEQPFK